jgi:Fe2+ transport system protein FeoA
MESEIEVKFLNIDHDALRSRLLELGAHQVTPMRLMKRALLDSLNRR